MGRASDYNCEHNYDKDEKMEIGTYVIMMWVNVSTPIQKVMKHSE
jgi:hypothetical protein